MIFVLTLLLFAGSFYLLMRLGCGARMVHGHYLDSGSDDGRTDPVCGMTVEGDELQMDFEGRLYRFCSANCRDRFVAHPEMYSEHLPATGKEASK